MESTKKAVIIGAGPAGLTAAYELLEKTEIIPLIFESEDGCGGLAKTLQHKGNRIDIGGHRFFSKSKKVLEWWLKILPVEDFKKEKVDLYSYFEKELLALREKGSRFSDPASEDEVMLIRRRLSRIYFQKNFFNYPLALTLDTVKTLGFFCVFIITLSYIRARLFPVKPENNLEDFYINRFGRRFYKIFFKDYTEKVWGASCRTISPEWGAQRVKGLSLSRAVIDGIHRLFRGKKKAAKSKTETTLIDQFLYPKYGPGQLWDVVVKKILKKGGSVFYQNKVVAIHCRGNQVVSVDICDEKSGQIRTIEADYFFSTMPISELIEAFGERAPQEVHEVAKGLAYLDFVTVGVLFSELKIKGENRPEILKELIPDNWIYIQEPNIKMSRIQIFNNWSPYMVQDPGKVWMGLEYTCREGDWLWSMKEEEIVAFAVDELVKIGVVEKDKYQDGVAFKIKKTYPAYFGSYDRFHLIRIFTDKFENLFLIGRNGMHHYNNQDHSMLTAMTAVENILQGRKDKANIWEVNTEKEYHEDKIVSHTYRNLKK